MPVTPRSSPSPKQPDSAIPDVLGPDLRVLFCGINPGRVSAAAGAHFANPRNDFWRLLHAAGFTSRLIEPKEQFELLQNGIGVTNAAARTTGGSGDLRKSDFAGAAERLDEIAARLRPALDRLRREGGLSRNVRRAATTRRTSTSPRSNATLCPPFDVAGERRGAVGGAAALVRGTRAAEPREPSTSVGRGRLACPVHYRSTCGW
jgi:G:T/U-mismatch repair DNA glycosylase